MDLINLLAFVVVVALLVISPGPNGLLIAKTVPVSGRVAGFANMWGFVAAFYVHGTLSVFGISVLLVQSAQAFFIFKILGAMYLCWIGVKSLLAAWKAQTVVVSADVKTRAEAVNLKGAFAEGFLTNMLNPKVSMFYLAAFPQFLSMDASASQAYLLVSAHAFINLIWFSCMVMLLSRLKGLAANPTFSRWLKSVTGVVFIGFGAKLAYLKP